MGPLNSPDISQTGLSASRRTRPRLAKMFTRRSTLPLELTQLELREQEMPSQLERSSIRDSIWFNKTPSRSQETKESGSDITESTSKRERQESPVDSKPPKLPSNETRDARFCRASQLSNFIDLVSIDFKKLDE